MKQSILGFALVAVSAVACSTNSNPIYTAHSAPEYNYTEPAPAITQNVAKNTDMSTVSGRILNIQRGLQTLAGEVGAVVIVENP